VKKETTSVERIRLAGHVWLSVLNYEIWRLESKAQKYFPGFQRNHRFAVAG
jgi:hypothetical protein